MTDRTKAMDDLIAQDADLIDKLRDDLPEVLCEKHWMVDFDAVEAQRTEAANRIAEQAAELAKWKALAETLAGALELITDIEPDPDNMQRFHDIAAQALTSYKEQRND